MRDFLVHGVEEEDDDVSTDEVDYTVLQSGEEDEMVVGFSDGAWFLGRLQARSY